MSSITKSSSAHTRINRAGTALSILLAATMALALSGDLSAQQPADERAGRDSVLDYHIRQFAKVLEHVQKDMHEVPEHRDLILGAIDGLEGAIGKVAGSTAVASARQKAAALGENDERVVLQIFTALLRDVQVVASSWTQMKEVVNAAMSAMLARVDTRAEFLDTNAMRRLMRGEASATVGVEVTLQRGVLRVLGTISGGPAARAGIASGDLVTQIDGRSTEGRALTELVAALGGSLGSPTTLTVVRRSERAAHDITMTREIARAPAVASARVHGDVGYIRPGPFREDTAAEVATVVEGLGKQGVRLKGYVLDLRGHLGGLVDGAVALADQFLEKGLILTMMSRGKVIRQSTAQPGDIIRELPLVVLIDEAMGAGAEFVAAALLDNHRARLYGSKTRGHGYIQTIFPLGEPGAAKITTAKVLRRSGDAIEGVGLVPDVPVLNDGGGEDDVLQAALTDLGGGKP